MAFKPKAFLMGSQSRWLAAPISVALLPVCLLCSSCAQRTPAELEPTASATSSVNQTPTISVTTSAVSADVANRPAAALTSVTATKSDPIDVTDPALSRGAPRLSAGVTVAIDPVNHRFVPGPAPLGSSNTSSTGLVQTPAITGGAFVRLNGHFQNQVTATVAGPGQAPAIHCTDHDERAQEPSASIGRAQ
jgi:hypothetical protein